MAEKEGKARGFLHWFFETGVVLKGINAVVEVAGGLALLLIPTASLQSWIRTVLNPLIRHDPDSFASRMGLRLVERLTDAGQDFAALYFLTHGVVKIFVVICLLRGWMWSYPLGVAVFAGFIGFQTWEFFAGSHSWFMIAMNVLDLVLIALTLNEWRQKKALAAQ